MALFLMGPLLGIVAYRLSHATSVEHAQTDFDEYASEQAGGIHGQLSAYVEVLHLVRAFYSASTSVTRDEFSIYTSVPLGRLPSLRAVEWIPRVPKAELDAHLRAASEAGLRGYEIREIQLGDGVRRPSRPSEDRYPVFYVEPTEGNEPALGIDLASEQRRADALQRAVSSGEATLCDPVRLVQDSRDSWGFVLFLPVFAKPEPGEPPGPTRVEGLVAAVFRAEDLVHCALDAAVLTASSPMQFRLLVGRGAARPVLVYESMRLDDAATRTADAPSRDVAEVAGLTWTMEAWPSATFRARHERGHPLLLGLVVFLGWEVLAGVLMSLLRSAHDLTVRRQADVVRSMLHGLTEGVVMVDEAGTVMFVNPAAKRMVGAGADDAASRPWSSSCRFFLEDGASPVDDGELPLARATRGATTTGQMLVMRRTDAPGDRWLSVTATPLFGEDGGPAGGVTVMRDVTAQRRSDEEVHRLASAVDQAADAVLITDRRGKIQYVNSAFLADTGYAAEDVLGKTPMLLKGEDEDANVYRNLWNTVLGGDHYRGTMINRRKSGEVYHAEQSVTPVRDSTGMVTHFVSVSRDVTQQVRLREREVDMRLAASIQQRLYPKVAPKLEGFDLAGAVFPAEETCGDYYDFIQRPGGSLVISVGDVCGHGFGPAIVMAQTRAYVRSLVESGSELSHVLERTNEILFADTSDDLFVSLILVEIEAATRSLRYANAGHPAGFVLAEDGSTKAELGTTGPALGIFEGVSYGAAPETVLEVGQLLFLLTDGATESQTESGDVLGMEGVLRVIRAHSSDPAKGIIGHVRREIQSFRKGQRQQDDITLVACKSIREEEDV